MIVDESVQTSFLPEQYAGPTIKRQLKQYFCFYDYFIVFFWVINSLTGITEKKIIQHEFIAIIQSTVVYIISEVISYVPPLVS